VCVCVRVYVCVMEYDRGLGERSGDRGQGKDRAERLQEEGLYVCVYVYVYACAQVCMCVYGVYVHTRLHSSTAHQHKRLCVGVLVCFCGVLV